MVNNGIPAFYNPKLDNPKLDNPKLDNPKLDNPSKEEGFLKRQRMRLIERLKALTGKKDLISHHKIRVLTRKLDAVEVKLGIKVLDFFGH